MGRLLRAVAAVGALLFISCSTDRKSSAGFSLPDGDPERGRAVFVALQCHACHTVAGGGVPAPVTKPSVPVVLGGKVYHARTDGELVTAVVHPSYRLAAGYEHEAVTSGSLSRMGDFTEAMTVRELIDLVAFLQSRYEIVNPPPRVH